MTTSPSLRPPAPESVPLSADAVRSLELLDTPKVPLKGQAALGPATETYTKNNFVETHSREMRKSRLLEAAAMLFAERGYNVHDAVTTALKIEAEVEARL